MKDPLNTRRWAHAALAAALTTSGCLDDVPRAPEPDTPPRMVETPGAGADGVPPGRGEGPAPVPGSDSEARVATSSADREAVGRDPSTPAPPADAPALTLPPEPADVDFAHRARSRLAEGDLEGALADLRRHAARAPRTIALLLRIGRLARQVGARSLARVALDDAAARAPDAADVRVEQARLRLDLEDAEGALEAARAAVDRDPEDPAAWNLIGRAAMARSAWQAAELALQRALELDPTDPMLANNLGLLHVYRRDGDAARRALQASIERFRGRAPAFVLNNLGLAHELCGDLELARSAFDEALRTDPRYGNAQINLARVRAALASSGSGAGSPASAAPSTETDRSARPREAEASQSPAVGASLSPSSKP